jgi:hypothetical protein
LRILRFLTVSLFHLGGGGSNGGSGGGGSSYCNPTPYPVTYTTGFQSGHGFVIISFVPPPPDPTSRPTQQPSSQPSSQPSGVPSSQPICHPVSFPTTQPSSRPSTQPTRQPSSKPTVQPSRCPSVQPTNQPTSIPTRFPSSRPSVQPSSKPTKRPSRQPSSQPTTQPSRQPTVFPSAVPTDQPTNRPSRQPTSVPSRQPTVQPSDQPSSRPSQQPSNQPTVSPTAQPTSVPSVQPTDQPSSIPSCCPTTQPTIQPSSFPSKEPSSQPTNCPSDQPTSFPSSQPTVLPTVQPSSLPSNQPSSFPSSFPSSQPSHYPTTDPSSSPTDQPTSFPSSQPTLLPTCQPTVVPTNVPSSQPTAFPSVQPSVVPTSQPTSCPTSQPTDSPSNQPTRQPTSEPSAQPSVKPSGQPTFLPSSQPTLSPTTQPSRQPSNQPTNKPSPQPSSFPTYQPTASPTSQPSNQPTGCPSTQPSVQPSSYPSSVPSSQPSARPSRSPSSQPSRFPTVSPTVQPTSLPSKQPSSSPSSRPTDQPTVKPSAQPFAFPTSAPQATIYATNGVLFMLGSTTANNSRVKDESDSDGTLGTSYVLFGRNFNHQDRFPSTISLSSSSSRVFVSEINNDGGEGPGIRNDINTRSTTIIGDVNGDGFDDLLVGYPLISRCSIYLGNGIDGFTTLVLQGESFAIVGDPEQGGGFLGWSSVRLGDLNGDGIEEIVVSAINANTIYVIYGKTQFGQSIKIVNVDQLAVNDGFKIIGGPNEINFGVALTLVHHFSKTGHRDLAITTQTYTGGQNIVYVLFTSELNKQKTIQMNDIMNNPDSCLRIVTPLYSFAGFSLAGIGDINSDGYDDLAIGSVPYYRGQFSKQQTFIAYGGKREELVLQELILSEMTEKQGFIISGAGFLVVGVDDVNYDGIADVLITDYQGWQGQRNAYLITSPRNMTFSPTIQPSSIPTRAPTKGSDAPFRFINNSTGNHSSYSQLFTPSMSPTDLSQLNNTTTSVPKPSLAPTRKSVFIIGTALPTSGKPTLLPSLSPTSGYHRLRGFPPSIPPTLMPTINNTNNNERDYKELDCSKAGDYHGNRTSETNYKFSITATSGVVNVHGNSDGGTKNLFVLYCPPPGDDNNDNNRLNVVIDNFKVSTDIISVAHVSPPGHSFHSLSDLSYYFSKGPLTFVFCSENRLQVILSSHTSFDLTESNFLFSPIEKKSKNGKNNKSRSETIQIGIVAGAIFLVLVALFAVSYKNTQTKNEKEKKNENNYEQQSQADFEQLRSQVEGRTSFQGGQGPAFDIESPRLIKMEVISNKPNDNPPSDSSSASSADSLDSLSGFLSSEKDSLDEKNGIGSYDQSKNDELALKVVDDRENLTISSGNWRELMENEEWDDVLQDSDQEEDFDISSYLSDVSIVDHSSGMIHSVIRQETDHSDRKDDKEEKGLLARNIRRNQNPNKNNVIHVSADKATERSLPEINHQQDETAFSILTSSESEGHSADDDYEILSSLHSE